MIKSSILFRQILFTIVLLMITGLGVGFTVYELFDDAIIKKERAFLKEETRHQNLPIIAALNTLRNDVQFLSQTPPIQGITHALAAGRVDPQDGSTVEIWQQQVQQIFQAMLQAKSDYLQICYIGIADQGRKIVRVDRKTDSITILDKDELQSKQNEPYFQETLHLGPGEVYLSELNLNKEHGKIVTPHEPVIRAATPVYGPDHTLFGIVIINMGMKPLFNQLQQVDPDNSFYIVNSSGDYLLHPRQEQTFGFEFGKPVRVQDNIPELKIAFNGQIDNLDISLLFEGEDNEEEDKAIHFHKIFFDPQKPGRFLGIINEVSFQELLADTKMVRYQTRGTTALLVLIGMVLAYFITRQLTRPLTQLAISADLVAKGDYQVSLPDNAVGEIRILT
ncbi:MAG: cache and HAMP domain-containing protein, partial [SAR324 cluster bacterium]|nr:cache and HAMP domain-containing protein [SAR324 cluster bacterium]